jgi:Crinkler effector protein N-terminal domain
VIQIVLCLNCVILGDGPDRTFTVEILKTKNVSILKDLIKEKNPSSLRDVDAKNIDLLQVNFLIDDLPTKAELREESGEAKMTSRRPLSFYFTGVLNDEYLHIVVRIPGMLRKSVFSSHI